MTLLIYRPVLILAVIIASFPLGDSTAHADDFDSLINLELAFRDTILGEGAPERFQTLIRDGETTITFVRDLRDTVGRTDYFLKLDWSYQYRYTTQTTDAVTQVTVTTDNLKLTPRLRHLIRLPIAFYRAGVWEAQLLGHEFDHVAVSLDPRPRALLVYLCETLPPHRFSIDAGEKPSDARMREGIDLEIRRRQSAILDLLQANYATLDKATKHGRTAMDRRHEFFGSLYTRSNLEAANFPFLDEVAAYLESDGYRRLRSHYVPADPVR